MTLKKNGGHLMVLSGTSTTARVWWGDNGSGHATVVGVLSPNDVALSIALNEHSILVLGPTGKVGWVDRLFMRKLCTRVFDGGGHVLG